VRHVGVVVAASVARAADVEIIVHADQDIVNAARLGANVEHWLIYNAVKRDIHKHECNLYNIEIYNVMYESNQVYVNCYMHVIIFCNINQTIF